MSANLQNFSQTANKVKQRLFLSLILGILLHELCNMNYLTIFAPDFEIIL